jgi:hypothetical protein
MAGKPMSKLASPLLIGKLHRVNLISFSELCLDSLEHKRRWINSGCSSAAFQLSRRFWW